jgi:hypothetical protein
MRRKDIHHLPVNPNRDSIHPAKIRQQNGAPRIPGILPERRKNVLGARCQGLAGWAGADVT